MVPWRIEAPTCGFARAQTRLPPVPVISVLSLKGGVGKTSVALGLAGAASTKGLRTLVIDLDPQGNATSLLKGHSRRGNVADVLSRPTAETIADTVVRGDWKIGPGQVDVLASHPNVIRFDAYNPERSFAPKLARALRRVSGYDLILIDCPPSLGALTREALAASDLAIVVTTPSYFGAQGVERAISEIAEIQRSVNPNLELAGIVVNRLKEKTEEHRFRKRELMEIYGREIMLKPQIPDRVAVQQAESTGTPVHALKSSGAKEIAQIFDKYLSKLLRMAREAEAE